MLTLNKEELVKETLDIILNNTGYDNWELLVCDNGSSDGVIGYIKSLNPKVHIKHLWNRGVAFSLNKLIKEASGKYICHMGNDILLPDGWMKMMVEYQEAIPETGICAIHVVNDLPELKTVGKYSIHLAEKVFGTKMYRKELVDEFAYHRWSKYGLEDSDLALRFYYQGLYNYYIPGLKGFHLGDDVAAKNDYREMKWQELRKAEEPFNKKVLEYKKNDRRKY